MLSWLVFIQAEDGIRDLVRSRGLGDVYKRQLEEEVEKQNSWQRVFMRGALYGLGTVIGATILLALFGSLIAMAVDTFGIGNIPILGDYISCLLYTSDAADERSSVDLGGRRIIKKKKHEKKKKKKQHTRQRY